MHQILYCTLLGTVAVAWSVGLVMSVWVVFHNLGMCVQKKWRLEAKTITFLLLAPMLLSPPFIWEWVGGKQVVINQDRSIRRVFDRPAILLQRNYDKLMQNSARLVEYEGFTATSFIHANPITENPKVRRLTCMLAITAPESAQAESLRLRLLDDFGYSAHVCNSVYNKATAVKAFAESQLFDFVEGNSRELARFYNPYNKTQQSEFRTLATEAMAGRFAQAGLQITDARFDIER